jgi:hypothetical protein
MKREEGEKKIRLKVCIAHSKAAPVMTRVLETDESAEMATSQAV